MAEKITRESMRIIIKNIIDICASDYMDKESIAKSIENYLVNEGIVLDLMEKANTHWCEDDIKAGLEFFGIEPSYKNVHKIVTSEFVRGFHENLVAYGNEMIEMKVREVFSNEV